MRLIKIAIAIPYAGLYDIADKTFREYVQSLRKNYQNDTECSLEIFVAATTDQVIENAPDCDVMIARGGAYDNLRRLPFPVPLVQLIVNGTDLIDVLLQLKQEFGRVPAAILGTPNMVLGVSRMARQLNVNVTPYFLRENSDEEIQGTVKKAISDGKQVIIGGNVGCKYARSLGVSALFIPSGRDSFWTAYSEAFQLAVVSQEERKKSMAFQTLLDNAYEGLVAIDDDNRIFFINASAIRILQLSPTEQYIGRSLPEVCPSFALNRILSSHTDVDEIIEYKSTHLSVKKMRLSMRGNQFGSVVTILNASQIQDTEDKLRGKLYQKKQTAKYNFESLLTRSPRMIECVNIAKSFAQTDSNIVIVGETGTGKEVMSQSIHNWSRRAKGRFIAINCAALPESLLESELFGYVDGAFTGAAKGGKPGLFEIAHNGTIFLDEISEIPLRLQGRLLRVLQEREIMRLGDHKVIPINIRVIAATNRNLEELVRNGKFRGDLYYRLYVLNLYIPPLRERTDDFPILIQDFIRQFQAKQSSAAEIALSHEDYLFLQAQPWLGNIRELRNFCERLVVLYQPGINTSELIRHLINPPISTPRYAAFPSADVNAVDLDAGAEYESVQAAIKNCRGNKTKAAKQLGISRSTLWRILKRYEKD